jgi:hypothetical protein
MNKKLILIIVGLYSVFWLTPVNAVTHHSPQQWRFKVYLDEQVIGYHTVTVNPEKTRATVTVEASFDVKFLFFTAYSYLHNTQETWENNCIKTIESRTNDNGDILYVSGQQQDQKLVLNTHAGSQSLPGCVRTFAYWNPSLLQARRLLNTQTGEYTDVSINYIADEDLTINGDSIVAKRYRLQAESIVIDLWYSDSMQWLALQTTTESGNQLRYQLEQLPV